MLTPAARFAELLANDSKQYLPLDAPITNQPGNRSASMLMAVLGQLDPDAPRYRPHGAITYCSTMTWDFSRNMGAETPLWAGPGNFPAPPAAPGSRELNANARHGLLLQGCWGWRECGPLAALECARNGMPALFSWFNPRGPNGHTGIVLPDDASGYPPASQLYVWQAGATCSRRILLGEVLSREKLAETRFFFHP